MNANSARLSGLTKDLWSEWQQTKNYWRDSKCQEFEQKYLSDLLTSVDKTVTIIEQLDKLITKVRTDCE